MQKKRHRNSTNARFRQKKIAYGCFGCIESREKPASFTIYGKTFQVSMLWFSVEPNEAYTYSVSETFEIAVEQQERRGFGELSAAACQCFYIFNPAQSIAIAFVKMLINDARLLIWHNLPADELQCF